MVKSRFAGLLRGILRRMDSSAADAAPVSRPVAAGAPIAPPPRRRRFWSVNPPPNANGIAIPLAPIIAGLPPELRGKIVAVPPGLTINLPVETVTAQLAFGAVKISFGELRQLAPAAFVNSGGEHDNKMISLPLGEILSRLNPALLARRTGPKVEVAADVNGPFGGRGAGVAFTTQPLKAPAPAPAPISAPVPDPRRLRSRRRRPSAPSRPRRRHVRFRPHRPFPQFPLRPSPRRRRFSPRSGSWRNTGRRN